MSTLAVALARARRALAAAGTLAAVSLGLAAPAHATTPRLTLQPLLPPGTVTGVYADGRYVELPQPFPTQPGDLGPTNKVRDDQTDQVKDSGCYGLNTVADGFALGYCPAEGPGTRLWSFATNTSQPTDLAPGALGGLMGRQWVPLIDPTPVPPFDPGLYYNWHTGEQRRALYKDVHLDSPTLTSGPELVKGTVILSRSSPQILEAPVAPPPSPLRYFEQLRVRDGKHTRLVRRCHGKAGCGDVTYSRGVISWVEVNKPYAYRVATRKTYTVDVPDGYHRLGLVTHTAKRLYFSADGHGPDNASGRQTVTYQARIPMR